MKSKRAIVGWACVALTCLWPLTSQSSSPVVISEFLARNASALTDEDRQASDWIELRNVSESVVNLEGWFLTDARTDLRRWRFPATNLAANGYLVVFASGKDRRSPGQPLHTNFRLDGAGDYLALVEPDGVGIATEFAPSYPEQFEDIAYGKGEQVEATTLVSVGASARYLVPRDGRFEPTWRDPGLEDSGWGSGKTGFGFSSGATVSGGGLYAYWPIREGSGNVASNGVTGGTHGTLHGATWAQDPVRGTVLSFNGRDNYVEAGVIPRMGLSSNFTWSFWYRQRSIPNANSVILGNRSGGAPGGLQFIKFTPTNFEYYHDGDLGFMWHPVPSDGWHHLAVVKQGASLTYYDNGESWGSTRAGGDIDANPFYWGGDPGAPGECVNGLIDDISLWTRALSADEIRALQKGASPTSFSGVGGMATTDVGPAMRGTSGSLYLRIPFTVAENAGYRRLTLRIQYDDGFVACLNGLEVARRNAPVTVRWDSTATAEHPTTADVVFEEIDLTAAIGGLVPGKNLLAIQGLNVSATDPDFLLVPELVATKETDLGWRYLDPPTPGEANSAGFVGFVGNVEIDRPSGFYDDAFTLTLTCPTEGATIRYTTDGTAPSEEHGTVYLPPLSIRGTTVLRAGSFKPGYRAAPTRTRTYLFLDQVLKQTGAGLPVYWGNDWQMDPRVVTNAAYAGRIRSDMKSLPVVSLALDPQDFWGLKGIYTQSTGRGDEYERAGSAELFFPDGSEPGFQVNCGIQIVGGASRAMTPKHGIGLTFKSRYGPARLHYRFFPNSEVDRFDFIALRPNFNMSWVRTDGSGPLNNANADGAERLHAIYVRDQFTKESQLAMGQPSAHERFVHLYINGLYWGLYNPSERTDASFAAAYLGGEKEEYDAIFSDGSTIARAHDGDKNAWQEMMSVARQGLSGAGAYARIQQYLDATNLADYMMLNFYCATVDWPWQNWNATRKREAGAQFRFHIWDAEYTLETPPWVPDDRTGVGAGSDEADSPAKLYHELRQNAEWRLLFADRVQQHCFNGGALTTNQTIPRFLRLCDSIDSAIVAESARWGDVVRRSQPYTRNVEWLAEKQRLLTQFFPQRTERIIQQFIRAGLYPDLLAPAFSQASGPLPNTTRIALGSVGSTVYYTTNGVDPRLPGGAIAPSARLYVEPIEVSGSLKILARAWRAGTWSALSVASFTAPTAPPKLSVTLNGATVVLSWPASASGFVLETADRLGPGQWNLVPAVVGNQATVSVGEGSRFYRLREQ